MTTFQCPTLKEKPDPSFRGLVVSLLGEVRSCGFVGGQKISVVCEVEFFCGGVILVEVKTIIGGEVLLIETEICCDMFIVEAIVSGEVVFVVSETIVVKVVFVSVVIEAVTIVSVVVKAVTIVTAVAVSVTESAIHISTIVVVQVQDDCFDVTSNNANSKGVDVVVVVLTIAIKVSVIVVVVIVVCFKRIVFESASDIVVKLECRRLVIFLGFKASVEVEFRHVVGGEFKFASIMLLEILVK